MTPTDPLCVIHMMYLDATEFWRLLPVALATQSYECSGDKITICEGNRQLEISCTALPELQVGSLRLPRSQAEFRFAGYTQEESQHFLEVFSRPYQRGGG